MKKIEREGKGFENDIVKIGSLFFTDDVLIIAMNVEEARENIRRC